MVKFKPPQFNRPKLSEFKIALYSQKVVNIFFLNYESIYNLQKLNQALYPKLDIISNYNETKQDLTIRYIDFRLRSLIKNGNLNNLIYNSSRFSSFSPQHIAEILYLLLSANIDLQEDYYKKIPSEIIEIILYYNHNCYMIYIHSNDISYCYINEYGCIEVTNDINRQIVLLNEAKTLKRSQKKPKRYSKELVKTGLAFLLDDLNYVHSVKKGAKRSVLNTYTNMLSDFFKYLETQKNQIVFLEYLLSRVIEINGFTRNVSVESTLVLDGVNYRSLNTKTLVIELTIGRVFFEEYVKVFFPANIRESIIKYITCIIKYVVEYYYCYVKGDSEEVKNKKEFERNNYMSYLKNSLNKIESDKYIEPEFKESFIALEQYLLVAIEKNRSTTTKKKLVKSTVHSINDRDLIESIFMLSHVDKYTYMDYLRKKEFQLYRIITLFGSSQKGIYRSNLGNKLFDFYFVHNKILLKNEVSGKGHSESMAYINTDYYSSTQLSRLIPSFTQIKPDTRVNTDSIPNFYNNKVEYYLKNVRKKNKPAVHYSGKSEHLYISDDLQKQLNYPQLHALHLPNLHLFIDACIYLIKISSLNDIDLLKEIDTDTFKLNISFFIPKDLRLETLRLNLSEINFLLVIRFILEFKTINYDKLTTSNYIYTILNSVKEENKLILHSITIISKFTIWYNLSFIDDAGRQYALENPFTNYKSNKIRLFINNITYNADLLHKRHLYKANYSEILEIVFSKST